MAQFLNISFIFLRSPLMHFVVRGSPLVLGLFFFFTLYMGNFKYIYKKTELYNKPHATIIQLLQLLYIHNLVLSIYNPLSHPELFEITPCISLVTIDMGQEFSAYVLQQTIHPSIYVIHLWTLV